MQSTGKDMGSFTGLLPLCLSVLHKSRKKKKSNPELMQLDYVYGVNDSYAIASVTHKNEANRDFNKHEDAHRTASNVSAADWPIVRQSSMDHLISRSSRGSGRLNLHASHPKVQFAPSIPHQMYAKLKKKVIHAFVSSSSRKVQRHCPRKLNDSRRFGGS